MAVLTFATVLEPSGQLGAIMATGTRIMYRSTDTRGNLIAVTGTYFEPYNDWPGSGPRPLISYAPGTQGQPMLLDGEAAMQWIAGRFNGVPTAPNCGTF